MHYWQIICVRASMAKRTERQNFSYLSSDKTSRLGATPKAHEFRKRFKLNWHKICIKFIIACWLFQYFSSFFFNFCCSRAPPTGKHKRESKFATFLSWLSDGEKLKDQLFPFSSSNVSELNLTYGGESTAIKLWRKLNNSSCTKVFPRSRKQQKGKTEEKRKDFNFLFTVAVSCLSNLSVCTFVPALRCVSSLLGSLRRCLYALGRMQT